MSSPIARRSLSSVAALASTLGLLILGCSNNPPPLTTTSGTTTTSGAAGSTSGTTSGGTTGTTGATTAGTSGGTTGGTTGGPPPLCCVAVGGSCASGADAGCCEGLVCTGSVCSPTAPSCAGYFEACGSSTACCLAGLADAGVPQMSCASIDNQGDKACLYAQNGQACISLACGAPLTCLNGSCTIPMNTTVCGPTSTTCQIGDDCSAHFNVGIADPCLAHGFYCGYFGQNPSTGAFIGACLQPFVVDVANGFPNSFAPCNTAKSLCAPVNGSSAATASICSTFWGANNGSGTPAPVCMQSCTTSSDCSSLAENCVSGACVPVYCFADSMQGATYYDTNQGGAPLPRVTTNTSVLFQPCPDIGGAPSYCLPQFDNLLGVASGLCFRVGGPNAGGLGAACNGNMYGNDPASMCAPGFLCDQGTCLQWCDVDDKYVWPCGGDAGVNTSCIVNHSLPFSINRVVARGTGVCAQQCDPYNPPPPTGNGCDPVDNSASCTAQGPVCKLTEEDTNLSPAPGLCLNGIDSPLPVGSTCNPVAVWTDPCVSGAACVSTASGSYVCTQLCDVHPSGGAQSSCKAPQTCKPLSCPNAPDGSRRCTHKGICQ